MTLRKLTIDISVRYVSQDHLSQKRTSFSYFKTEREIVKPTRERKVIPKVNFHKRLKNSIKTLWETFFDKLNEQRTVVFNLKNKLVYLLSKQNQNQKEHLELN